MDKTTGNDIVTGEQFSGSIGTSETKLKRLNDQVINLGYVYDSVTAIDPDSYDQVTDTATYTANVQTVTYYYTLAPGSVTLTKTDKLTSDVLSGAVFELQDENGTVL